MLNSSRSSRRLRADTNRPHMKTLPQVKQSGHVPLSLDWPFITIIQVRQTRGGWPRGCGWVRPNPGRVAAGVRMGPAKPRAGWRDGADQSAETPWEGRRRAQTGAHRYAQAYAWA